MSTSRFGYSEAEMADAFEQLILLPRGLPEWGQFGAVYREVSCRQGRADFVAIKYPTRNATFRSEGIVEPALLSVLHHKTPHKYEYLISRLEFRPASIDKGLRALIETGQVEQVSSGAFRLTTSLLSKRSEVWSFELKLSDPRRAVFQAQQSRAYANRAIIVVPPGQEKNYDRFRRAMYRWHIGLATFNPVDLVFRVIRKGRTARPLSQSHQIYALSQMSEANALKVPA